VVFGFQLLGGGLVGGGHAIKRTGVLGCFGLRILRARGRDRKHPGQRHYSHRGEEPTLHTTTFLLRRPGHSTRYLYSLADAKGGEDYSQYILNRGLAGD